MSNLPCLGVVTVVVFRFFVALSLESEIATFQLCMNIPENGMREGVSELATDSFPCVRGWK